MKKIIAVLLLLCLCACSNNKSLFKYNEITILDMSDSSKEIQDKLRQEHSKDYLKKENVEVVRESFKNVKGQSFPSVNTNNTLDKFSLSDGDVYTLSSKNSNDCIVLYIHGGVYAYGIDGLHVSFCDKLVDALNAKVYMPLYPLVYESDYTGAYKMLDELYPLLLKENLPIYIMGDSAGGGLSLAYCEYLNLNGKQLPNKMVLLSPWSDVTLTNPDIKNIEERDLTLSTYVPSKIGALWAGDLDPKDPLISPLYGEMKGLPDTLIFNGADEITYPDNILLFNKMKDKGVKVAFIEGTGFWHVFPIYEIEEQKTCIEMIQEHVNN